MGRASTFSTAILLHPSAVIFLLGSRNCAVVLCARSDVTATPRRADGCDFGFP